MVIHAYLVVEEVARVVRISVKHGGDIRSPSIWTAAGRVFGLVVPIVESLLVLGNPKRGELLAILPGQPNFSGL